MSVSPFSYFWRSAPMRAPAHVFERERFMYEPIIGLCVAMALGVYLVYTLLHPEKF
jgi:K+-transporting ATPase KdpF subunit